MTIAEKILPDHLTCRLSENSSTEGPASLLAYKKRGADTLGVCLAAHPDLAISNDDIAAERPNGQLSAAITKAQ